MTTWNETEETYSGTIALCGNQSILELRLPNAASAVSQQQLNES